MRSLSSKIMTPKEMLSETYCLIYSEFLIFICNIAHSIYIKTKQESEPMHIKIEGILEPLFKSTKLKQMFSFVRTINEEDEWSKYK